jgi:soluble lytic murein transglycosylase-like protein
MTTEEIIEQERAVIMSESGIDIDPNLVLAIIHVESGDNAYAVRYEPGFYKWLQGRVTTDDWGSIPTKQTELRLRATSFGLMQVLGQVAREHGFEGMYLTELCDPEVGIRYGMRVLAKQLRRYASKDDPEAYAVSAYNRGSAGKSANGSFHNQYYVNKVYNRFALLTQKDSLA